MVKRATLFLAATIFCSGLAACDKTPEKRFDFKGKVEYVDKKGKTITVAHEDIPGYMDAMTMPFILKDEWAFDVLAVGDRVQAVLVVKGDDSWLEGIVISREEADQTGSAMPQANIGPAPGDEVPNFTLVNQDGKPVSFNQYRGRTLLLTFIYTRCPLPDYCPLMTKQFAEIDNAIKSDSELYNKTRLLSISIDPDYDTPDVLRKYAAAYAGDGQKGSGHWEFATGSREEVKKVASYFGLQYSTEKDQILHSLSTAMLGPDGKVLKLYRSNEWRPAAVVSDLRALNNQP